jgi:ubiquitin carboxyl-terminal hydrolase 4/11/15
LSSVRPLTDYFISGLHSVSLNKENPFGTGGAVATAFGALIKEIYKGSDEQIYPENFLKSLEK